MLNWQTSKDPLDVLDYYFAWNDFLRSDESIISFTLTSNNVAVINSSFQDGSRIGLWISGGASGQLMVVKCIIVTDQGRTAERSASLPIQDK